MGTFTWSYFLKGTVKNNWPLFIMIPIMTYTYLTWWKHTDRTQIAFKNQSMVFGGRKVPPGEDPWKW